MVLIWLATMFGNIVHFAPAVTLWAWFGVHWVITLILLLLFG